MDDLARRLPRFAYFPFGGGPRVCIGNALASLEMVPLLATIVRAFRLTLASDVPRSIRGRYLCGAMPSASCWIDTDPAPDAPA